MSKTSTEAKRKWNNAHYKRYYAEIKIELFERLEAEKERLGMSRAQLLEYLLDKQK